jgi:hypothetical protein
MGNRQWLGLATLLGVTALSGCANDKNVRPNPPVPPQNANWNNRPGTTQQAPTNAGAFGANNSAAQFGNQNAGSGLAMPNGSPYGNTNLQSSSPYGTTGSSPYGNSPYGASGSLNNGAARPLNTTGTSSSNSMPYGNQSYGNQPYGGQVSGSDFGNAPPPAFPTGSAPVSRQTMPAMGDPVPPPAPPSLGTQSPYGAPSQGLYR